MTNTLKPLVVITGASSGIGLATAKLLSSRGHALLLLSRRLAPMEQLQLPNTLALAVDITDRAAVLAAVAEGIIQPRVWRRYPLAKVARAHRDLEQGLSEGALVLTA